MLNLTNIAELRQLTDQVRSNSTSVYLSGYYDLGDGGGGYFILDPIGVESDDGGMAIVDASTNVWRRQIEGPISVKFFGAKGNGVNEDLSSIQAANEYVANSGGGSLYFPAGHYFSSLADGIPVKSFVEYHGDGYASFLDFNWNVFNSNSGFGRNSYFGYTYYPANAFAAGAISVSTTSAADANNFVRGDIILIVSTTAYIATPSDTEPYFVEVNRVVATNAATGEIILEDPINDGWVSGAKVAKLTNVFAENFSIHGLRCRSAVTAGGAPFKISAMYKAKVHDCWGEGAGLYIANGCVRSEFYDLNYKFNVVATYISNLIEMATGSHDSVIRNCLVEICNLDGCNTYLGNIELAGLAEFSRRTHVHDLTVNASDIDFRYAIDFSTGGGHRIERINLSARKIEQLVRIALAPPGLEDGIRHLPQVVRDIDLTLSGSIYQTVVTSAANGETLKNIDVSRIHVGGASGDPYSLGGDPHVLYLSSGTQDCVFDNITARGGTIYADTSRYSYKNTVVRGCVTDGPADAVTLNSGLIFQACSRAATEIPGVAALINGATFNIATVDNVLLTLPIPQNANIRQGDRVRVRATIAKANTAETLTVRVHAFGSNQHTEVVPGGTGYLAVVECDIFFMSNLFNTPTLAYSTGEMTLNGAPSTIQNNVAFNKALTTNAVELRGWLSGSTGAFSVVNTSLKYIPCENLG